MVFTKVEELFDEVRSGCAIFFNACEYLMPTCGLLLASIEGFRGPEVASTTKVGPKSTVPDLV